MGQATIGSDGDNLTEAWTNTDGTEYAHAWMIFGDTPASSTSKPQLFSMFVDI